jgi:hypothetical protein
MGVDGKLRRKLEIGPTSHHTNDSCIFRVVKLSSTYNLVAAYDSLVFVVFFQWRDEEPSPSPERGAALRVVT